MKIDNKEKIIPFLNLLYFIIFSSIIIGIFLYKYAEERLIFNLDNDYFLIIPLILSIIVIFLGYPIFIYESSGETVNIRNRTFYGLEILDKDINFADFPKRKIKSYKIINNIIRKKLILTIISRNSNSNKVHISYNITYLSNKNIKKIKISLKKIIEENKENI